MATETHISLGSSLGWSAQMFDESTPDNTSDVADGPDGSARRQRTRDLGLIGSVKTKRPFGFAGSGQARMDEEDAYYNSRFPED